MGISHFVYSSVDEHLGFLHFLAIMNNATMNICVEVFIYTCFQFWMFIGRTDAEAKSPILWPPDEKNWLIWKDPDAGTDWRQEEKGMIEDEMAGWHHRLEGHKFEQASGVGDG